jgi:hypothetical protein
MSLSSDGGPSKKGRNAPAGPQSGIYVHSQYFEVVFDLYQVQMKTLDEAIAHLHSLRPRILELLSLQPPANSLPPSSETSNDGKPPTQLTSLIVPLTHIDIMKPDHNDPRQAHVLFAGPSKDDEEWDKLYAVTRRLSNSFSYLLLLIPDRIRP